MARKKITRIVLDAAMTAMIVFEMFIQFTGEFLHEVIGFAFFGTLIVHLALSAKWMKGTARAAHEGKLSGRRRALAAMAALLAVAMVALIVSSIAISGLLSGMGFVWPLGPYALWATIHTVSSYALCALVVIHLAMHWTFLASALRVPYDPSRRQAISTGVHAAAAIGAVAVGVVAARELIPQQTAQAVSSSDNAGGSSDADQPFATVQDTPLDDSDSQSTSGTTGVTRSKHRKQSPATTAGKESAANVSEPSEETPVQEPQLEEAPVEESIDYEETYISEEPQDYTVTGICTLCRKQCSLSAPRCNKPYEAGLI